MKPLDPWGVQLVGSSSDAMALAVYRRVQEKYALILGDREPRVLHHGLARGSMGWARVHVGADIRASADKLCAELRAAGGAVRFSAIEPYSCTSDARAASDHARRATTQKGDGLAPSHSITSKPSALAVFRSRLNLADWITGISAGFPLKDQIRTASMPSMYSSVLATGLGRTVTGASPPARQCIACRPPNSLSAVH